MDILEETLDVTRHTTFQAGRRHALGLAAAGLCAGAAAYLPEARAQSWPGKPIKLLVPFPTSSPPDISSRLIAGHLGGALGQPVVVENKPGAIGMVAVRELQRQPADGYTLLCMVMPLVTASLLLPGQQPDLAKELAPIGQIDFAPSVLVANNDLPAASPRELVNLLKAKPGSLNYGSGGNGTPAHLAAELFKQLHGVDATHVPYAQFSQVLPDLITGRIQFMFLTSSVAVPFIQSGKIKALGVAAGKRVGALPNVPTLSELGMGSFDTSSWNGLAARAGTPADIVTRLSQELRTVLTKPEVVTHLNENGMIPVTSSPEQFGQFIAQETQRWVKVIQTAGIKPQ